LRYGFIAMSMLVMPCMGSMAVTSKGRAQSREDVLSQRLRSASRPILRRAGWLNQTTMKLASVTA
jgi:hypothetical protein